jgi:hypothetical protein
MKMEIGHGLVLRLEEPQRKPRASKHLRMQWQKKVETARKGLNRLPFLAALLHK